MDRKELREAVEFRKEYQKKLAHPVDELIETLIYYLDLREMELDQLKDKLRNFIGDTQ